MKVKDFLFERSPRNLIIPRETVIREYFIMKLEIYIIIVEKWKVSIQRVGLSRAHLNWIFAKNKLKYSLIFMCLI